MLPAGVRTALAVALAVGCAGCMLRATDLPPPAELVTVHEDLGVFWRGSLDGADEAPRLVLAQGDRDTGCGQAEEDEGSFYCAQDDTVYVQQVDLDDFAALDPRREHAATVVLLAHEYGHAVQDRLQVDEGEARPGPDGDSVPYELQADCLAGAYTATRADAADPAPFLAAVSDNGDDAGADPVAEAEYEHGSSAQRLAAFRRGLAAGPDGCDLPA